jgi:hypothetical protein
LKSYNILDQHLNSPAHAPVMRRLWSFNRKPASSQPWSEVLAWSSSRVSNINVQLTIEEPQSKIHTVTSEIGFRLKHFLKFKLSHIAKTLLTWTSIIPASWLYPCMNTPQLYIVTCEPSQLRPKRQRIRAVGAILAKPHRLGCKLYTGLPSSLCCIEEGEAFIVWRFRWSLLSWDLMWLIRSEPFMQVWRVTVGVSATQPHHKLPRESGCIDF